ncbi:MAG: DUF2795 domain-containing protein [Candidatus Blackburnbacteria bacterium]|nr:DUF2795 domain-containing protein [Candidatus Blackburnbacteria bacterium]
MARVILMKEYLSKLEYPAWKSELVDYALQMGAADNVISALTKLPNREYFTPAEVKSKLTSWEDPQ